MQTWNYDINGRENLRHKSSQQTQVHNSNVQMWK
jgi:hypothetical protein